MSVNPSFCLRNIYLEGENKRNIQLSSKTCRDLSVSVTDKNRQTDYTSLLRLIKAALQALGGSEAFMYFI